MKTSLNKTIITWALLVVKRVLFHKKNMKDNSKAVSKQSEKEETLLEQL